MKFGVFFARALVAAMLFGGFAVRPAKAPFTVEISERQITTNRGGQMFPAVSGDIIVWTDNRNGWDNTDIYMYDLSTSTETRITTNPENQLYPDVSGDIIVWHDYRNDDLHIYMYVLSTSTETQITTNTLDHWRPAVSGGIIVWTAGIAGNPNSDIYMTQFLKDSDINDDGKIDIKDLARIAKWFGKTVPPAPSRVDINYDNQIDKKDLTYAAKDFGKIDP